MRRVHATFYTRPGCHLCDDATRAMVEWASSNRFLLELREVNIELDEAAHARYWLHIPVATIGGEEAFRHRFDAARFGALAAASERGTEMGDLADRSCVPCSGAVAPLREDALRALHAELGARWAVVDEHHLAREFRFPDFAEALAFVNRIGAIAEEAGHHPDLELSWGRVGVVVYTHAAGGLTESDFVLAARIGRLAEGGTGE